jgi:hypothetical protein
MPGSSTPSEEPSAVQTSEVVLMQRLQIRVDRCAFVAGNLDPILPSVAAKSRWRLFPVFVQPDA